MSNTYPMTIRKDLAATWLAQHAWRAYEASKGNYSHTFGELPKDEQERWAYLCLTFIEALDDTLKTLPDPPPIESDPASFNREPAAWLGKPRQTFFDKAVAITRNHLKLVGGKS